MRITAKVRTSQPRFSVAEKDGFWSISVTSPPEKNRANREIIRELSKRYGSVRIAAGLTSRRKIIEIKEK